MQVKYLSTSNARKDVRDCQLRFAQEPVVQEKRPHVLRCRTYRLWDPGAPGAKLHRLGHLPLPAPSALAW